MKLSTEELKDGTPCFICGNTHAKGHNIAKYVGGLLDGAPVCDVCAHSMNEAQVWVKWDRYLRSRSGERVRFTGAPQAEEPVSSPLKDRALIWEDCPACAYKHLTAAYAALTMGAEVGQVGQVGPAELFAARARILFREAASGYPGNFDAAIGCLAMAELTADPETTDPAMYRRLRLQALEQGSQDVMQEIGFTPLSAAGAHFAEALRELPELACRVPANRWVGIGGFCLDTPPDFLTMLREQIKWLAETYELRKGGAE